jgi:hypothetical protein
VLAKIAEDHQTLWVIPFRIPALQFAASGAAMVTKRIIAACFWRRIHRNDGLALTQQARLWRRRRVAGHCDPLPIGLSGCRQPLGYDSVTHLR